MPDGSPVRGSPFLQAVLVIIAFAFVGVPVWKLTRPDNGIASVVSVTGQSSTSEAGDPASLLRVEAVFAPAPADFQIRCLDRTVLEGHGPETRFTAPWTTNMPREGVDLVVQAHWPTLSGADATANNPAASRITVRFADGRQVEKSFWSAANGALADVFTILPDAPAVSAP